MPRDMRSFMVSYEEATELKTAPTVGDVVSVAIPIDLTAGAVSVLGMYPTSRLLLRLGHIGEAEVCETFMVGLALLLGAAGAGEAAVGSGRLEDTALCAVVQCSPGKAGRHRERS